MKNKRLFNECLDAVDMFLIDVDPELQSGINDSTIERIVSDNIKYYEDNDIEMDEEVLLSDIIADIQKELEK